MQKLWRRLIEPAPAVRKVEERRRARLLAALVLVLLPLYFISSFLRTLLTGHPVPFFFPATLVLIAVYGLSRTKYFRLGLVLILTVFTAIPLVTTLSQPIPEPEHLIRILIWIIPTLVLGSLLLRPWGLLALETASVISLLLLTYFVPPEHAEHLFYLSGFVVVVSSALLIATILRQRDLDQIEAHARQLAATAEELRLFSRAVEQSASTIVITDPQGNIEYVNPAFTRITGYTREEAIGQTPRILKSGKHPPELYEEMWQTISSGGVWQGELINKKKNGDLYWEAATISPILDEEGRIIHYLAVKDDITIRKEMERKLQQSEQRFRYLFEAAPDAVLVLDRERIITDCNSSAVRLYGRPAEEMIGQKITEFMAPSSISFSHEKWQLVRRGQSAEGEILIVRGDGRTVTVWRKGTPLLDAEGNVEGVLIYDRDITRRKEAEAALARAHEEALAASQLKTQLLANVSHDMRTPLGVILGRVEMLQEGVYGPLTERQREVLRDIINSTEQALTFVNNLLGQAQIESGRITFNTKPFSPSKLIETALSTARALAQAKGLELKADVAPDMPPKIKGDPYWLQQILSNLVSNAIKFTEQGVVSVRIYRADADRWAMEVADTGCGIPPEAQEFIFEPFRQVDGTASRQQHTGSGLGLSIVKELTTLMGGEIRLDSTVGQGSTFTILLPYEEVKEGEQ